MHWKKATKRFEPLAAMRRLKVLGFLFHHGHHFHILNSKNSYFIVTLFLDWRCLRRWVQKLRRCGHDKDKVRDRGPAEAGNTVATERKKAWSVSSKQKWNCCVRGRLSKYIWGRQSFQKFQLSRLEKWSILYLAIAA